ncbi:MAG TPA: cupin domain-containing protein [Longimicrobiaceae bacterium]
MSSINRPLTAPNLTFDLTSQLAELRQEEAYHRSGRAGRTLAKSGRMRVTLVAMTRGNVIGTHQADSPLTLHVLEGHIRFRAGGEDHELQAGQLLFFGPGDAHDLTATEESALLLTLSAIGDDFGGGEDEKRGLLLG